MGHGLHGRGIFTSGTFRETGIHLPGVMNPLSKIYTFVPEPIDQNHFFTLYLPPGSDCNIRSGNADIIRRDEDCVYIKTYNLQRQ